MTLAKYKSISIQNNAGVDIEIIEAVVQAIKYMPLRVGCHDYNLYNPEISHKPIEYSVTKFPTFDGAFTLNIII